MKYYADLHNHSKYSRATSPQMDLHWQTHYGKIKGLNMLGTGDFTHPLWLKELKQKLTGNSIYNYNGMNWVLSAEVSNIYHDEGLKKIHHILLAPDFETVDQIIELLNPKGKLASDGRPIFGGYSSRDLVYDLKHINQNIEIIPAHIWTPWFSLFGSKSGYNNIKDCYKDQLKYVHALETGLSSDPEMNWQVSQTHRYTLLSNSDSHSPWPWRLGRECNVFDFEQVTYEKLIKNIRENKLDSTIEVDPNYGKYHYDGHRACGISLSPEQTRQVGGICPKCHAPLTIGVLSRVMELTDKPIGFKPDNAVPFKSVLPLAEIIRVWKNIANINSQTVRRAYDDFINKFGNEFKVLFETPIMELNKIDETLADMILQNREGKISYTPGFDGVYGEPLFSKNVVKMEEKKLNEFF
ncbi:MAG: DNA helicase UvrD [Nanoarchaeota archaeon]|nr:DNA helicase UvrD [Nanoarchaeota archaeon]